MLAVIEVIEFSEELYMENVEENMELLKDGETNTNMKEDEDELSTNNNR